MIGLFHLLTVSAFLFAVGIYAVLAKKNAILMLIGIEFMINAGVLNLVAFGRYDRAFYGGQTFALFAIVLAAAAVAVALAIILNVYKHYKSIDPDDVTDLRD
ncbi:NADH-quinone oxidoreductase subunit NuoK [Olivibacter ginsenosidimutans]|uniref:NADH-quinone oxidoreductase subunit K n=1 Tax=Olivibacter ginsenosidimutans TaxID=1176537 RepID=A0ABP9AEM2_9SPHI